MYIDWKAVIGEFSPTKLTIGLGFYVTVRSIVYSVKFTLRLVRGWLLSSERRVIMQAHLRHKHPTPISKCIAADCRRLRGAN